jgi:hypothetical protein
MITYQIAPGTTDVSVVIRIIDSADGTPETGVVFNTSGIDLEYRREGEASTDITEATLAALTTAHTDGGFLHVGNGYYRLDLPDAACATGVPGCLVHGTVTGMVVVGCYIQLQGAVNKIYSDTTIIYSDTTIATSKATQIYSDTAIASSKAVQIYSDTTIIYSDTTIATSKATQIYSDTTIIYSDTTRIHSDTTVIEAAGASSAPDVLVATTIATLSTQTSFTLTAGSADNDAYNGMAAIFTDQSTSNQKWVCFVSDYVGSTRTVTLESAPGFTIATGDSIAIMAAGASTSLPPPAALAGAQASQLTRVNSKSTQIYSDTAIIYSDTTIATSKATQIYSDTAIASSKAVQVYSDTTIIYSDTTRIHSDTTHIDSDTTHIESDAVRCESKAVQIYSDTTAVHSDTTAIQTKTDSLTFTQAGHVDANVQRINDVAITGNGGVGTEFSV